MRFTPYRSRCLAVVLGGLLAVPAFAALPAAVDGQPLPSLAPMLERVTPSVVNVYTRTRVSVRRSPLLDDPFFRRFFDIPDMPRERISRSLGSGVVVDADQGYVLTNNHVIDGADDIAFTLADGRSLEAEVIGTDPDTDLAVIRVDAEGLSELPLADSDSLRVGDFVVAVGNPFGLGQTVTSGIVSALGRSGVRGLEFQNFIQTDASINPGNSGGALVNLAGELVGINSAIFTPSGGNVGIGFAVPSRMASYVLDQLVTYGTVRRGTLGLYVQDLSEELSGALAMPGVRGALVAEVARNSAAAEAGLRPGDVITAIDGRPVRGSQEFLNVEGQVPVDTPVEIRYLREGREREATARIEALRELVGGMLDRRLDGAVFTEVPVKQRADGVVGVLLEELSPQSYLARKGLRPGDVITGVNRERVRDLQDFETLIAGQRGAFLLQLRRRGEAYLARID